MTQFNVNEPGDGGDRTAAAGVNLITVLIVLAVLVFLAWFLFTGPMQSMFAPAPNINVNPPAQQAPAQQPPAQQPPAQQPPAQQPPAQQPPAQQPPPPGSGG